MNDRSKLPLVEPDLSERFTQQPPRCVINRVWNVPRDTSSYVFLYTNEPCQFLDRLSIKFEE